MITYLYWITTVLVAIALLIFFVKNGAIKMGLITTGLIVFIAWAAYFFHFEQVFVKRFGGVMNIEMRDNEVHLGSTWKGDNLWIETYNPETRTCHFREFSKGNMLQGRVNIHNCKPLNHSNIVTPEPQREPEVKHKTNSKKNAETTVIKQETTTQVEQTAPTQDKPITLDDMPVYP